MEETKYNGYQTSKKRIKVNRNFTYNRNAKEESRSDWNTHYAGKMMMRSIQGFIEKWKGRSFNKCLHEFVSDPRFKDSKGWKMYGSYYTPRAWFDRLFEREDYMVDDQGRIYDPNNKHHKLSYHTHRHMNQGYEVSTGEAMYWKWNMEKVNKYRDELAGVLGNDYINGLNEGAVITSQEKLDMLEDKLNHARIVNKDKPYSELWGGERIPNYLNIKDFLIHVKNVEVIPYGSKQYNSMSNSIEAQRRNEAKQARWEHLVKIQRVLQEAQRRKKESGRSFISEYIQLLKEEKENGK